MDVSNRRIVILGKTGSGKSSLANTIFGENRFKTANAPNSETRECKAETKSVNGRRITLIDTPGFFDTHRSEEEMKLEIVKCITECAPGPHAFLIVLKFERYTEHEQAVITKIRQYFSEEAFKYATVLFTHGEELDEGQKIEDFVRQSESLKDLIAKCGGRCHVVDNKYWNNNQQDEYRTNKFQVKELLKTIDEIYEANEGGCYTNEMLQAVEEQIQQEAERIRLLSGNMSEGEVRERAKSRVEKSIWIKLAGIATGVLLGALLGAAAPFVLLCLIAKTAISSITTVKEVATAVGIRGGAAGAAAVTEGAAGAAAVTEGAAGAAGAAGAGGGAATAAFITATVVSATVGAAMGGAIGHKASEEADTPLEAVKMTAAAFKDEALSLYDGASNALYRVLNPKSKQS